MVTWLDSREYKMSAFSERRRREEGIFFKSEFLEEGEEKDVERTFGVGGKKEEEEGTHSIWPLPSKDSIK